VLLYSDHFYQVAWTSRQVVSWLECTETSAALLLLQA
jgi:hypothetical protein